MTSLQRCILIKQIIVILRDSLNSAMLIQALAVMMHVTPEVKLWRQAMRPTNSRVHSQIPSRSIKPQLCKQQAPDCLRAQGLRMDGIPLEQNREEPALQCESILSDDSSQSLLFTGNVSEKW